MTTTPSHRYEAAAAAVADAVTAGDRHAYLEAVERFREAGGSDAQIKAEYSWRNQVRMRAGRGHVMFDVAGKELSIKTLRAMVARMLAAEFERERKLEDATPEGGGGAATEAWEALSLAISREREADFEELLVSVSAALTTMP